VGDLRRKFIFFFIRPAYRKGSWLTFQHQDGDFLKFGNVTELGDAGVEPWEEFSFLFNGPVTLKLDYPEIG